MSKNKRGFIAHLRRIYKEDREPEVEGLMHELKKRRMQFYTRDDGKKTLVLVQPASWRRGKAPQHDWPAYFKTWGDDPEDMHETYLIWSEELGANPIAGVESLRDFLIDEEDEEEDVSYR